MNAIQERAVRMCFQGDSMCRIVLNVLRKHKEHKPRETPRVTPLEVLSIQSIMAAKLKDNVEGLVIYSLVFGERLDILEFPDTNVQGSSYTMFKGMNEDPPGVLTKMCEDPEMVLAVVEHNLDRMTTVEEFFITVYPDELHIKLDDVLMIKRIPHRKGVQFDIYWAERFATLAFSKGIWLVYLMMLDDNDMFTWEQARDHMKPIIDNLNASVPPEGWKEAIENGRRAVYDRVDHTEGREYEISFENHTRYDSSRTYWGWIDKM